MRIKLLGILFCGILLLGVSGCKDKINKNVKIYNYNNLYIYSLVSNIVSNNRDCKGKKIKNYLESLIFCFHSFWYFSNNSIILLLICSFE